MSIGTNSREEKGFTLIELLVVIAIIGILAAVVLASLNSAREKARNAAYVAQLKEYQKALDIYFSDNGTYPAHGSENWACLGTGYAGGTCFSSSGLLTETVSAGFRTAMAPYIDVTAVPATQIHVTYEGAIYRQENGGRNYRVQYMLEGAAANCPIGTYSANASYAAAGVTNCIYTHPL